MNRNKLPRILDFEKAIDCLAAWVAHITKDAPGLVIGLSGTDSALTYLMCSKAMQISGKSAQCLVGIHYGKEYEFKEWFEQYGAVRVVNLPENSALDEDAYRWAAIQTFALKHKYWLVGTRNRTEQVLGDYSNASLVAVMHPLMALWKSEVLALCEYLKMPERLVASGWLGDEHCYCLRPCLLKNIHEYDKVLAGKEGEYAIEDESFYEEEIAFLKGFVKGKEFKSAIPYLPPNNVLREAILKNQTAENE